ncbi:MAG: hypothetical protein V3U54_01360 [Thermodesulfobacteriota bacterium]
MSDRNLLSVDSVLEWINRELLRATNSKDKRIREHMNKDDG